MKSMRNIGTFHGFVEVQDVFQQLKQLLMLPIKPVIILFCTIYVGKL